MGRIILSDLNADGVSMEILNTKIFDVFSLSSAEKVSMQSDIDNEIPCTAFGVDNVVEWFKNAEQSGYAISHKEKELLPVMELNDITERIMLNGKVTNSEELSSKDGGLWANSGTRLWEIRFDKPFFVKSAKTKVQLHLECVNGESISVTDFRSEEVEMIDRKAIIKLDTDLLNKVFELDEFKSKHHLTINGKIEVKRQAGGKGRISFYYPCTLVLINTSPEIPGILNPTPASIDFGTSSTCVAIDREGSMGFELLSLSSDEENGMKVNIYENPTNIMVFDWDKLYMQWIADISGTPILFKGDKSAYLNSLKNPNEIQVDFDFGYNVKEILSLDDSDRRELNSILSLIKMIPYKVICQKEQMEIIPYNDADKFVNVVTDYTKQDKKNFDPVAFYGYLIGRAINDNSKRTAVYTNFNVTRPVMFNDEVKNTLCRSLEYGLKMSVPKSLRSMVRVNMNYTEPVAYIGAVCGTDDLKVSEGESKLAAVYDFGGGTLDFSYGVVSCEDGEVSIDIKHVSGRENFGGESIIERISFMIYCDNIVTMKDNDFPIIMPYGEKLPDDVPEKLISHSDYAHINMNLINAAVSRKIFEDPDFGKQNAGDDGNVTTVILYDKHGEQFQTSLNYNLVKIKDVFLSDLIEETINQFEREMDSAFVSVEGYDRNKVHVFMAGNSSRNEFVQEYMYKKFTNVHFVDSSGNNRRYSVNPKTAVAIGQLKLNNFTVNGDGVSFKYYVGFVNQGDLSFVPKIRRGSPEAVWTKFRKISNDSTDIFFCSILPEPGNTSTLLKKPIDTTGMKGRYVFVRVRDEISLEYCISASDSQPAQDETEKAVVLALNL